MKRCHPIVVHRVFNQEYDPFARVKDLDGSSSIIGDLDSSRIVAFGKQKRGRQT